MKTLGRKYISVYFGDAASSTRKRGYITLAFPHNCSLYKSVEKIGTQRIRELLDVKSYEELKQRAIKDARPISTYIKIVLKRKLGLNRE